MKTKIFYIIISLFAVKLSTAQVLFSENFDNLAVGEVSTDPSGATPGKGGWYVTKNLPPYTFPVEIVAEPGRGNVLAIGSNKNTKNGLGNNSSLTQKNINILWNNRTFGNNILKLEYDIFLDSNQSMIWSTVGLGDVTNLWTGRIFINNHSGGGIVTPNKGYLNVNYLASSNPINFLNMNLGLNNTSEYNNFPYNTWFGVQLFIDYTYEAGNVIAGKIYVYIPALNILKKADFTHSEIIDLLMIAGGARADLQVAVKYDNIKLMALNTLPSYILSNSEFISQKFNLYPNPATNVVNITNAENMLVNKVTVYDSSVKQLSTQSFNNENQIQLNVENLASGTYMLHLQTNEGIAVKKLVKK